MKVGDIIEFRRRGLVSGLLGGILGLFERDWDGWGWHMGVAWQDSKVGDSNVGWYVLEALSGGVEVNFYTSQYLEENTRGWQWLEESPSRERMDKFLSDYVNKKYDVVVYFWTMLQYLVRHYFNRRIPRLLDERYTCWELAFWFCREMGRPIQSIYDCPLISDAIRAFKVRDGN